MQHETKYAGRWLIGLFGVELVFAFVSLDKFAAGDYISDVLGQFFPIITNFDVLSVQSHVARNYIALTLLLLPIKMILAYWWIQELPRKTKDILLTTPYTSGRSWVAKTLFLIAISAFAVGISWYVLFTIGDTSTGNASEKHKHALILANGFRMWIGWVLAYTLPFSLLLACLIAVLRDWALFFFGYKSNNA